MDWNVFPLTNAPAMMAAKQNKKQKNNKTLYQKQQKERKKKHETLPVLLLLFFFSPLYVCVYLLGCYFYFVEWDGARGGGRWGE